MNWLESIAAELPAPRADEPPDLRRRIVAEINDHLQLAFVRELHLVRDENKARENVLARFGDPRRVARKLWFEAMQEKIMSQRLVVASSSVTIALCLAMGFFLWHISAQSAETSRALIEETRELNRALIEKLGALGAPGGPPQPEFVHLSIRLVQDAPGNPPAVGYRVWFRVAGDRSSPEVARSEIDERSDANGTVDCGFVRWGNANIDVYTPWEQTGKVQYYLRAGQSEQVKTIVCPTRGAEDTEAVFTFDVPDDLRDRVRGAELHLTGVNSELDGVRWERYFKIVTLLSSPEGERCRYTQDPWVLSPRADNIRWYTDGDLVQSNDKTIVRSGPVSIEVYSLVLSQGDLSSHGPETARMFLAVPINKTLKVEIKPGEPNRIPLALDDVWDQVRQSLNAAKNDDTPSGKDAPPLAPNAPNSFSG